MYKLWKQKAAAASSATTSPAVSECPAQIHDLWASSSYSATEAGLVLRELAEPSHPDALWRQEHGSLYPKFYDSGPEYVELLRGIVGWLNPSVVVETGVAHGKSTRGILDALVENRGVDPSSALGILHSFEVDPRTKTEQLSSYPNWRFHLLDRGLGFEAAIAEIGPIDMFVHDSDHSYENQMKEYQSAWRVLKPGGVLVSDDVNWSWAFRDFSVEVGVSPILLFEAPKLAGVLVRPQTP